MMLWNSIPAQIRENTFFILVLGAAMNIWLHLSQKRMARQCVLIAGTESMDE